MQFDFDFFSTHDDEWRDDATKIEQHPHICFYMRNVDFHLETPTLSPVMFNGS